MEKRSLFEIERMLNLPHDARPTKEHRESQACARRLKQMQAKREKAAKREAKEPAK